MAAPDPGTEVLRVYPSRTLDGGWWCPAYGELPMPQGWEFLPAGDAFLTREVKRLGPHYWAWLGIADPKDYALQRFLS